MDIKEYISSGIIEAYVMGLCSPQEKHEIELLRQQHPDLNDAILQFELQLEKQFVENPSATNTALDNKILNSFVTNTTATIIPIKQQKSINWLKPLAAAATVLLIGSAIFNYILFTKNKEQQQLLATKPVEKSLPINDFNILKKSSITPVAMMGVGIHSICRCTMFWDKATGKAYVMVHHLMPVGNSNDYQLWATVNGKQVSIGLINEKIRDRFIEVTNVPSAATEFSVTLEQKGGATTPTIEETYLVGRI
jgi:anti-sigma-K factor RskA